MTVSLPSGLAQATPHLIAFVVLVINLFAATHVLLNKRDVRAITGWVAVIWLVPWVGAVLYLLFGVNRLRRRAQRWRILSVKSFPLRAKSEKRLAAIADHGLEHLLDTCVRLPFVGGNRVDIYQDGDEAFPVMLEAIAQATRSVALCTYIFDYDRAGVAFADALRAAADRGVDIRVLIDAMGARYSRRPMHRYLRRAGIHVERFLQGRVRYLNLRNHRKLLIVDGSIGFTGGMNIREGNLHYLQPPAKNPTRDIHALLRGPVVSHLLQTFAEDWMFSCGEALSGEHWFSDDSIVPEGSVVARGVADGPDEDFETLRYTLLGLITAAKHHIRLVTPYFLPDDGVVSALNLAAMRGVEVDILIPERGNLRLVEWATIALAGQLVEHGCRIWRSPPPFDHSKLLVVDDIWTLLGSANWDARSIRLNFEFNVACCDRDLGERVNAIIRTRVEQSKRLSMADIDGRGMAIKVRDSIARLATPYL